ncbi:serine hydrolase [Salegentibacter chungangensis]|uniref:Serine hydrolase n=1 Tax=Salegentibacter chungangensis TaxID=1335724 RepID=A0ABW3NWF1_9FLAO
MKFGLFLVLLLSFVSFMSAQRPEIDEKLEQDLSSIIEGFNGDAGVYVYNLKTGKEAAINADTIFPTASIVKVPILIGVFDKIDKGQLYLTDSLLYNKERAYGGSGLMQFYRDSTQTDLRTLSALMITFSDNTTSLWNQELAGGGEEINRLMEELGLRYTRVNSRTEGRKKDWEEYGWGQTTPREMASLLVKMRKRELISPASSDEMYRMMSNSFYTDYALSQIPPYVQTAAKQGMVNDSRSELVMVNAPNGDYVFYIATKNNKDQSWNYDNEAWQLQRRISAFLWNYFEPQSDWSPAEKAKEILGNIKY